MTRASKTDLMPIMQLGDDPAVADYLDTMSGPLCYTYTDSEW
jgi:tyrosinase